MSGRKHCSRYFRSYIRDSLCRCFRCVIQISCPAAEVNSFSKLSGFDCGTRIIQHNLHVIALLDIHRCTSISLDECNFKTCICTGFNNRINGEPSSSKRDNAVCQCKVYFFFCIIILDVIKNQMVGVFVLEFRIRNCHFNRMLFVRLILLAVFYDFNVVGRQGSSFFTGDICISARDIRDFRISSSGNFTGQGNLIAMLLQSLVAITGITYDREAFHTGNIDVLQRITQFAAQLTVYDLINSYAVALAEILSINIYPDEIQSAHAGGIQRIGAHNLHAVAGIPEACVGEEIGKRHESLQRGGGRRLFLPIAVAPAIVVSLAFAAGLQQIPGVVAQQIHRCFFTGSSGDAPQDITDTIDRRSFGGEEDLIVLHIAADLCVARIIKFNDFQRRGTGHTAQLYPYLHTGICFDLVALRICKGDLQDPGEEEFPGSLSGDQRDFQRVPVGVRIHSGDVQLRVFRKKGGVICRCDVIVTSGNADCLHDSLSSFRCFRLILFRLRFGFSGLRCFGILRISRCFDFFGLDLLHSFILCKQHNIRRVGCLCGYSFAIPGFPPKEGFAFMSRCFRKIIPVDGLSIFDKNGFRPVQPIRKGNCVVLSSRHFCNQFLPSIIRWTFSESLNWNDLEDHDERQDPCIYSFLNLTHGANLRFSVSVTGRKTELSASLI